MTKSVVLLAKQADTKHIKLTDQATLESLTEAHAEAYENLASEMRALNAELVAAKQARIAAIRALVVKAKVTQKSLNDFVDDHKPLFDKPRTQQLHGFKVGLRKLVGKLAFDDEQKAVALVRKHFPDQFDILVDTSYSLVKGAADQLSAAELKSIGGRVTDSTDEVVIKPVAGDVEKLVDALIKETGADK